MASVLACAIGDAHRRLMDVHAGIHAMANAYMNPYEFRRALNTAVQDARSVTFLLQKRKASLPDFDEWYSAWVDRCKSLQIMAWAIESRNRIVKEEDLAIASTLRIEYRLDWLTGHDTVLEADPMMPPDEVDELVAFEISRHPGRGLLTVRREWIDLEAANLDLIDVMLRVFEELSDVVALAHRARGQADCNPGIRGAFPCENSTAMHQLPCLMTRNFSRRTFDLAEESELAWSTATVTVDRASRDTSIEKYGSLSELHGDAIERAGLLMTHASRVLQVDEFHAPFTFLIRDAAVVQVASPVSANKRMFMAQMDELSRQARLQEADGVVHVAEAWFGEATEIAARQAAGDQPEPSKSPFYDPDFMPGRREVLMVSGMTSDGRMKMLQRPFTRHADGIQLHEVEELELDGTFPNFLVPFVRAWGLDRRGDSAEPR